MPRPLALLFLALSLSSAIVSSAAAAAGPASSANPGVTYFPVTPGSHPHDVAPAPAADGPVYYTAQRSGKLGILDPKTGQVDEVPLGAGSSPHGVIVGPDGAAWITDSGLNAIVRYDPKSRALRHWPLPGDAANANLNTPAFDAKGRLWFTGQSGVYGRLVPASGELKVWKAPRGRGPYGITGTPDGQIYYASLAGNHIAAIDPESGAATIIEPPTAGQGARRVWSDSRGKIWVAHWNSGQLARFDPAERSWREWALPGKAHVYAVWVDENDKVWLAEWESNAIVRFDPTSERFTSFASTRGNAAVRQILGRRGEVWAAESGHDRLVRIHSDF